MHTLIGFVMTGLVFTIKVLSYSGRLKKHAYESTYVRNVHICYYARIHISVYLRLHVNT